MLSLFPSLLAFEQLAPFFLRLTLGVILIHWSFGRIKRKECSTKTFLGFLEGIIGLLLVVGLWTQLASLVALIIFIAKLVQKIKTKALFTDGVNYYFILFIIALCLLFLGPGVFSFDLPL